MTSQYGSPLLRQYNEWLYGERVLSGLPRDRQAFLTGQFGPLTPMVPMPIDQPVDQAGDERPPPRRFEYRVGWNMPIGVPGSEGLKLVSFSNLRAYGDLYCLDPATRILCKDLTWRPLGELKIGDELIAFDETAPAGGRRKFRTAQVESCDRIVRPSYRIRFTDGREVIASGEHRWLAARHGRGVAPTGNICEICHIHVKTFNALQSHRSKHHGILGTFDPEWITTAEMRIGCRIKDFGIPWERDKSWEAGYLAGVFDGEASLYSAPSRGYGISFAQKPGAVMDLTENLLRTRVEKLTRLPAQASGVATLNVRGLYDSLRLMGECGQVRLNGKVAAWLEGRQCFQRVGPKYATVESIEFLGDRGVVAIGTSTKTLIAEGLFSHNSVARACVRLRIDEILGLEFDIIPTDEAAKAYEGKPSSMADFQERRRKVVNWFKRPDTNYHTFNTWFSASLEDHFIIDAPALYLRPPRVEGKGVLNSNLAELQLIDGATIRPLLDIHGATPRPPNVGYQQYLYGVPRVDMMDILLDQDIEEMEGADPVAEYRADQLLYFPHVRRSWTPYGLSSIERGLIPIVTGLKRQQYQLQSFCYDSETEILTRDGWRKFIDLHGDEEVATRSPAGEFQWQQPVHYVHQPYDGEMIRFKSNRVDLLVTPNHRMLVKRYPRGKTKTRFSEWHIRPADYFVAHPGAFFHVPATSTWKGEERPRMQLYGSPARHGSMPREIDLPMEDFCRFMGLYLAEGWTRKDRDTIYISQFPQGRLEKVREILKSTGLTWWYDDANGKFETSHKVLAAYLRNCGSRAWEKHIPDDLMNLEALCLAALLEGLLIGDGTLTPSGQRRLATTSLVLAEQVQELAQKTGEAAWIKDSGLEFREDTFNKRPCYHVAFRPEPAYMLPRATTEAYRGLIHCVNVPNGIIYIRRNGQPLWCGNTEGTVPETFISPGPSISNAQQQRQLQDTLNAIAGDQAWKHKMIVLPPGSQPTQMKEKLLSDVFDTDIKESCLMAFEVLPMELGLLPGGRSSGLGGKGVSEGQENIQQRRSTKPLLAYYKAIFDLVIQEVFHQTDMECTWHGLEPAEDIEKKTAQHTEQVKIGAESIDEMRAEFGKQPWGTPVTSAPHVFTATGLIPLNEEAPAPVPEDPAQPDGQDNAGDSTPLHDAHAQAEEEPDQAQKLAEIDQLRNYLRHGKDPLEFVPKSLSRLAVQMIAIDAEDVGLGKAIAHARLVVKQEGHESKRNAALALIMAKAAALMLARARAFETDKASPIAFITESQAALEEAYRQAYLAGAQEQDPEYELDAADENMISLRAGKQRDFLMGMAQDMFAGLSANMLASRIGLYTSGAVPAYEQGYATAFTQENPDSFAIWHTSEDERVCEVCDPLDGEQFSIEDLPFWPGDGGFGGDDNCRGGSLCRCWLEWVSAKEAVARPLVFKAGWEDIPRDYHGQWTAGGDSGPELKATTDRAWSGKQTQSGNISKLETGKLGEKIALEHLRQQYPDAHMLNEERPNYAIDGIADHAVYEIKAGLSSNGPSAQQWRETEGQPGKAETEWLRTASREDVMAYHQAKQDAIVQRKEVAAQEIGQRIGHDVAPRTIATIINPNTKTVDVYQFEGFHTRIAWRNAASNYVKSYRYG